MSQGVLFRPVYFDLVKDINAALLMSQIHYWYLPDKTGKSKLRVYKHGHWWLVKSHEDWWNECRLTRRQVDRALAILVGASLIKVETHRFGGVPTRHIICPPLASLPIGQRDSFAPTGAINCTPGCNGLHSQVHSLTETTAETTTDTQYEDEDMATTSEILSQFKSGGSVSATGFQAVTLQWKKSLSSYNEGGFVKSLTGVEQGQLKHVFKALGPKTAETLKWAVEHWQKFSQEAAALKGLSTVPQQPTCGFFCQHYDVAVQLIAGGAKQKPVAQAPQVKPAANLPVLQQAHNAPQDDAGLATQEDVMATLAALEKVTSPKE